MNFIEAIKYSKDNRSKIKRKSWADGVMLLIKEGSQWHYDEIVMYLPVLYL